jgi:hypothetical protein
VVELLSYAFAAILLLRDFYSYLYAGEPEGVHTDFLQRMLSLNRRLRISPREALAHPFFSPSEQWEVLRKQTRERVKACRMRKKEE